MTAIPNLERHCGSWVIVYRPTGRPALETFSRKIAEHVDQSRFEVVTAAQWLARVNAAARQP